MADFLKNIMAATQKQPPREVKMSREMESRDELQPPVQQRKEIRENNLLVVKNFSKDKQMKEICIYLPTAFKFYINELKEVNFIQNRCSIEATIGLQIYYGDLDSHLVDEMLYMSKIGSLTPTPKKDNLLALMSSPSKDRMSAADRRRSIMSNMEAQDYAHLNDRGYLAKMYLDHQRPIYLAKSDNINVEHKKFQKLIKYSINDKFDFKMDAQIFWFPITQIQTRMGLYLDSALLDHTLAIGYSTEGSLVRIGFNFMHTDDLPIIADEANLGKYQFAESLAKSTLTIKKPERRKKKKRAAKLQVSQEEEIDFQAVEEEMEDDEAPIAFQRAKVGFGMYTISGNYIARSFFRFKFLGILVMFNYFTAASFAGRMGRLAFLTVGLFALLPVMQASLPVTTTLVLPQILVIVEQINVLLCVISSYQGRNNDYNVSRYKWEEDPWFLIALSLHLLSIFITVGQFFYFKCVTEAQFQTPPQLEGDRDQKKKTQTKSAMKMMFALVSTKLIVVDWKNIDCRGHFNRFKGKVYQGWKEFINDKPPKEKYLQIPLKV